MTTGRPASASESFTLDQPRSAFLSTHLAGASRASSYGRLWRGLGRDERDRPAGCAEVPASGDCAITVPFFLLDVCCVTLPTSTPAFLSTRFAFASVLPTMSGTRRRLGNSQTDRVADLNERAGIRRLLENVSRIHGVR